MPRYRVMDHTADLGVYFYGATPEEVLINAGAVLFELMLSGKPRSGDIQKTVILEGLDLEDLLVRWLSELLYFFSVRKEVMTGAEIKSLSSTRLEARIKLAPFDPATQALKMEIKAPTYHQLELKPREAGWRARVIFDL
ncbi:MAG: archease [Deltaproteobacteria bacterium]|nr:archease [Deltaproteobacteria bacterium]MBW2085295.1 archease [Deltaproteobacteria bacterium]